MSLECIKLPWRVFGLIAKYIKIKEKIMKIGKKYIVTTDNWFYGKDGKQYRGVFGTLKGVFDDKETFSISTNRNSTNWYAQIGSVRVAGCQIHYVVEADVEPSATVHETTWKDDVKTVEITPCRVYNADQGSVNGFNLGGGRN